ncbi:tyrosine-protein phosphatase [Paenibacillus sp. 1P07SE]|uniref:tyrosine-protein phosphatase n=1 Tax=Paenibacillus sp. 1P07SE TaxID=3132209 RepID=UPI0039A4B38C
MAIIPDRMNNRIVALEGAHNFRDMGGYPAEDGRTVKYGILFRSDELGSLTDEDGRTLQRLSLRTMLDYRTDGEAERSPTPALAGVEYRRYDTSSLAAGAGGVVNDTLNLHALNRGIMLDVYGKLPFANPAYRFLLEALADPKRHGILHHCAGGKDRTGVGALLILKLLGVSDETAMADYLLTNETLGPKLRQRLEGLAGELEPHQLADLQDIFVADPDYLQAAIDAVVNRYDTWDNYFAQEFGITPEERDRIREFCLVS